MAKKLSVSKTGDGFPKDATGHFIGTGDLVFMAPPAHPLDTPGEQPKLILGYVEKVGKTYADVRYFLPDGPEGGSKLRVREPHPRLIVVDPDRLDSRYPHFEAVKLAAAKARTY